VTPPKRHRLPLLDGLRGVAAIMVMLHHRSGLYGAAWPLPRAYLAVDFFFMLSGLVLTPAFEPRLRTGLSPERFLMRRIIRLWPVLAAGVVIGGLHAMVHQGRMGGWPLAATLAGLLMLPLPQGPGGLYRLDGPQWSIAFELLANWLHARLLVRLKDGAVLGLALLSGAVMLWQIAHFGSAAQGDTTGNWWGGFARVTYAYALGVWMGRRMMTAQTSPTPQPLWWVAALPLPLVLGLIPLAPIGKVWGDGLAVFALLPAALWWAARASIPAGAARLCGWLGALSYPLYALHAPLLVMLAEQAHGLPQTLVAPWRACALTAVLALSILMASMLMAQGIGRRGQSTGGPAPNARSAALRSPAS
jgi:peptidoglycan/LPS O-acetylase OafA/YrhL